MIQFLHTPNLRWEKVLKPISDFLYPAVCVECRRTGAVICASCQTNLAWIAPPVCQRCGNPTPSKTDFCTTCQRQNKQSTKSAYSLTHNRAALWFNRPIRSAIHALKYHNKFGLAAELTEFMVIGWERWQMPIDVVVPIPLHAERQAERGYNQADLLAQRFAQRIGLPFMRTGLERIKATRPQVEMGSPHARKKNVSGAFEATTSQWAGQRILLIDDVCTSGATLHAAADALRTQGAQAIYGYCLARATRIYPT